MPAASSAAATLSPGDAVIVVPSTDRRTVPESGGFSRWNIEPPGGEDIEIGIEPSRRDHRRHRERVVGGKGDAAMAGRDEGAGTSRRLLIDGKPVCGHDAQGGPAPHDVEPREQRKHA